MGGFAVGMRPVSKGERLLSGRASAEFGHRSGLQSMSSSAMAENVARHPLSRAPHKNRPREQLPQWHQLRRGYEVVRKFDAAGEAVRGERRINEAEAAIVRRIFKEFANGRSPRAIAQSLNKDGIPGPAGRSWGPSTIYGNWRRGTGILNNDLYAGRVVWNRQQFVKDPNTGRRRARPNPETKWIMEDVPHRRIIDDHLWSRVKERQRNSRFRVMTKDKGIRSERARRPNYLLSGLLKCGTCGGGFSKISEFHYGCSTARNKGTCDNRLTVRRDELEAKVLDGLRHQLMHPELVTIFIDEFHREVNQQRAEQDGRRDRTARDLEDPNVRYVE